MRTYRQASGREPDFVAAYRLYAPSEGGRKLTHQHLKCDFLYEGDDPRGGVYMIHPEFLDARGEPLPEGVPVPLRGFASMWIVSPEMRPYHRMRIGAGVRGHFMEGLRKVGDVEVVRVVGLNENPSA